MGSASPSTRSVHFFTFVRGREAERVVSVTAVTLNWVNRELKLGGQKKGVWW